MPLDYEAVSESHTLININLTATHFKFSIMPFSKWKFTSLTHKTFDTPKLKKAEKEAKPRNSNMKVSWNTGEGDGKVTT